MTLLDVQPDPRDPAAGEPRGLWGRAFRPFFLGLAVYGAIVVPVWVAIWLGALPPPRWLQAAWWHGHEMIFGFVAAAMAGFLLTASPVWTGGPALTGRPLAVLVSVWVAGRLAFACASVVPHGLVAAIDLAFLPGVAVALARTLWGSGQIRNYGVLCIVVLLAGMNAAMHAGALGLVPGAAGPALRAAVDTVVVLLLVISGRITPAFTRNAFLRDGVARRVRSWPAVDVLAVAAAGALVIADLQAPRSAATGALALVAGFACAIRLVGWQTVFTGKDPLLWSLHAGSVWVAFGLLLVGAGDLGAGVPSGSGLHALTAGGMGATILAVVTRVGLGHTGRALVLPDHAVACHALVHAGAAARVAAPFLPGNAQRLALLAGALAWAAGFGLFALLYRQILIRPRPDGRPG